MDMLPADPWFWFLALIGVTLTGVSKSGFAGGVGVLAVPLLALHMPVVSAATLMLPLLLLMDAKTVHYTFRAARLDELRSIVPAALAGIGIGGFLLGRLDPTILQLLLALFSILFALWHRLAPRLGAMPGAGWLWGSLSGLSSTLLHAGGPPISIYFIARVLPKKEWLATAALFFAVMNLVKLLPYTLNDQWQWQLLLPGLILVPVAFFGVWLGHRLQALVSELLFTQLCRGLLFASGCGLLIKALGT